MVVAGFQDPIVTGLYLIAMVFSVVTRLARRDELVSVARPEPSALLAGDPVRRASARHRAAHRQLFDAVGGVVPHHRAASWPQPAQSEAERHASSIPTSRPARCRRSGTNSQVQHEARQPGQQTQVPHHRRRHRSSRRRGERRRSLNSATTSIVFAFKTARAGLTASRPRAASMRPRIIKTTATAFIASFTTPSRAAIFAPVRPTSTAWPQVQPYNIIDQLRRPGRAVRARVRRPALLNRSFGGAHGCRAPSTYCRGQTGQQLLLGIYQSL